MPSALETAIKYLSRNERFEGEVRKHLQEFGVEEVEEAISHLTKRNILNDERTLQSYLRAHSGRKATGVYKMEYELRSRGASEEIIARLSQEILEPDAAEAALSGKFRPDIAYKDKGYRFLLSRGFSYESAMNAVRKYFESDV